MMQEGRDLAEFTLDSMKAAFSSGFVPKAYALEMPKPCRDKIRRSGNVMKIRPVSASKAELYGMYGGTGGFSYTCGGACLFVEEGESEEAFLLRAATVGITPEIRLFDDDEGKSQDVVDMETGVSLVGLRRKALSERKGRKR